MQKPVKYFKITNPFKNKIHYGIDLGWSEKSGHNQPIYAVEDGEVIYKAIQTTGGKVLHIKHSNGYVSEYGHLNSWTVNKGDKIKKGQQIGTMGKTGKVKGEHLHFGLYKGTSINYKYMSGFVNPVPFLSNEAEKTYKRYVSDVDYEGLWVHTSPKGPNKRLIQVGTEVTVYETKSGYSRIGENEWVYSKYLKASKPKIKTVTAKDGLNVRKVRSIKKNNPIACLKYGTPVQVFKTLDGWSKVSPNTEAWVSSNFLK